MVSFETFPFFLHIIYHKWHYRVSRVYHVSSLFINLIISLSKVAFEKDIAEMKVLTLPDTLAISSETIILLKLTPSKYETNKNQREN